MNEESTLDFNFWPAFADLMLALVLILVLVLFMVVVIITAGTIDFSQVEKNQRQMINSIARSYGSEAKTLDDDKKVFGISINEPNNYDIVISNEPGLQRITFSDKILFDSGKTKLNEVGEGVLKVTGESLTSQLPYIREIQIQGHADTNGIENFPYNLQLGSARAIEVFTFFKTSSQIDPAAHLMSATTFGEYKPVQRDVADDKYDLEKLGQANLTDKQRGKNRRIEILLFYRR
jgi:flagellar motor protein MotB